MDSLAPGDLNNIRFLIEVVRAGSFSAAARQLQLPPSAVSRRMARLEEDLGVRLLQRTTRSLQVTEVGRTYLEYARRAFEELEAGQRAVGEWQRSPRGRVRLSAPSGFGEVLWSLLPTFLADNPEVRLELELAERYVDLVEERFDLALRSTRDTTSRWVGYRFGSSPRELYASPSYLETRGSPRSVQDLTRHDCIVLGARSDRATWTLRVGKTTRKVTVRGRIAVNEARLAARAAASGFGIALLAREDLPSVPRERRTSPGPPARGWRRVLAVAGLSGPPPARGSTGLGRVLTTGATSRRARERQLKRLRARAR
jgi:DNA-binding transcriptional LysR family regulator